MPWIIPSLRDRRRQARDDIAAHLPDAASLIPNAPERVMGDAFAALTHDNDRHLAWVARMMMPDTAEGEYADRWAGIWLPEGRKAASYATGQVLATGTAGAGIATGVVLTASAIDASGTTRPVRFEVTEGATIAATSALVTVTAIDAGAIGNLEAGAQVRFDIVPPGIDGAAAVADPGLAGGADIEADLDLIARYVDVIQNPPHGGNANDYRQWALAVPGVTRAWVTQEMGVGTVTVRVMLDEVRATQAGIPQAEDLALVLASINAVRPVTAAQVYVPAPIAQPLNVTLSRLTTDTPEVRAAILAELGDMLRRRAAPGVTIWASWIGEAVSIATGEDSHTLSGGDAVALSAGHIAVPGTLTVS